MASTDEGDLKHLRHVFEEFVSTKPPRLGEARSLVDGADIDLYGDEGYLYSTVRYFLRGVLPDPPEIPVDYTIDKRLAEAGRFTSELQARIDALVAYRSKMLEVIEAFAKASKAEVISKEEHIARWTARSAGNTSTTSGS